MKTETNKILMLILKDGKRQTFSLPNGVDVGKQYIDILNSEGLSEEDIKSNYYFPKTRYTADNFQNYFNEEHEYVNEHEMAIDFKLEEFRKQRSSFFIALDLEFMKSIEEDCEECKKHVVKIKNFFRNLPFELSKKFVNLEIDKIIHFNAFNNVMGINIMNGGSGYTVPPEVTVSPPEEEGFPMEARAVVKDGVVIDIIVIQAGSGYTNRPKVTASPPDTNGEVAILVAKEVENDSYEK